VFERPHHQRIAQLLLSLDGDTLRAHKCLFGGGTAIALRFGEYRESVDVDFLVADKVCYRDLRSLLRATGNLTPLLRQGLAALTLEREIRIDQYGIRAMVNMAGTPVKFEIIHEGRIALDEPGVADILCGIPTLTRTDMIATKLLANSDRWIDSSVMSRDVIADLEKAIARLLETTELLERCMGAMAITTPRAVLWQRLRVLRRVAGKGAPP